MGRPFPAGLLDILNVRYATLAAAFLNKMCTTSIIVAPDFCGNSKICTTNHMSGFPPQCSINCLANIVQVNSVNHHVHVFVHNIIQIHIFVHIIPFGKMRIRAPFVCTGYTGFTVRVAVHNSILVFSLFFYRTHTMKCRTVT